MTLADFSRHIDFNAHVSDTSNGRQVGWTQIGQGCHVGGKVHCLGTRSMHLEFYTQPRRYDIGFEDIVVPKIVRIHYKTRHVFPNLSLKAWGQD